MGFGMRWVILWGMVVSMILSPVHASATSRILIFGDSLVAGYGLLPKEALPVRVEALLKEDGYNVTVFNGGVSGDTTSGGRSRLGWTLDKSKPELVVLALGGNDLLRAIPPSTTKANLEAMLKVLQQQKLPVVLVAVSAPLNLGSRFAGQFNTIYPDLAKQYRAKLYPFFLEKVYGKRDLMLGDGVHPNAKGVEVIAGDLAEFIATHFLKKKSVAM